MSTMPSGATNAVANARRQVDKRKAWAPLVVAALAASVAAALLLVGPALGAEPADPSEPITIEGSTITVNYPFDPLLHLAINMANQQPGRDKIVFDFRGKSQSANFTASTPFDIQDGAGLTIDGGDARIDIRGDGNGVFEINKGAKLTLNHLTVEKGYRGSGGGIWNRGTLTLINSTVSDNRATFFGGGIYNEGTARLVNSTISQNQADPNIGGSGIFNKGTLTATNSTIAMNHQVFSSNHSSISTRFPTQLQSIRGSETVLKNTIVSNGISCGGDITDGGHNLSSDNTCRFTQPSSLSNVDPRIVGLLRNDGGPTPTLPLGPGSPAIDAGNNASAVHAGGSPLSYDQRGPGFPRVVGGRVDIGAYEYQPPSPQAHR